MANSLLSLTTSIFIFVILSSTIGATVPPNATFTKTNFGEWVNSIAEYGSDFRVLDIFASPFQICFYNATPDVFYLGMRMGNRRSGSIRRWAWEANRGSPVRDDATLSFGSDGNLVLANPDGRVAWQTNTANKGVVGLDLLSNGNFVLYDQNRNFVWQSFHHPTDTILVGQSLLPGTVTRLVSRASTKSNINGRYSLVLEPTRLALYYRTPNSRKPYLYYSSSQKFNREGRTLKSVTFNSAARTNDLYLQYQIEGATGGGSNVVLAKHKRNSTLSFLRIGMDGNVVIYTYDDKVESNAWEVTFRLFGNGSNSWEDECQLPEKCGNLGLCENNKCVACPTPSGLTTWTNKCAAPMRPDCGSKKAAAFKYYKLEGVEHFTSKYGNGEGPMREDACGRKCSSDCKCLGYFYHMDTSMCWIAYDLKTIKKVPNSKRVGYIKAPKS